MLVGLSDSQPAVSGAGSNVAGIGRASRLFTAGGGALAQKGHSKTGKSLHSSSSVGRFTRLLRQWGEWQEQDLFRSVYPAINVLSKMARTGICEPFRPGHRVLTRDMPSPLRRVQKAWLGLESSEHRQAVWLKYVIDRDQKGVLLTDARRAEMLECSYSAFRDALMAGRRLMRREIKAGLDGA